MVIAKTPYVGVNDLTTAEEASCVVLKWCEGMIEPEKRKIMLGVMMSRKTLNGIDSRWSNVFPKKEDVASIFYHPSHSVAEVINCLHYADYEGIDEAENLLLAAAWGGKHLHALQLDMIWPKATAIERVKKHRPEVKIVLQVNTKSLEQIEEKPYKLFSKLHEYGDMLDYVLLDKSMGKGQKLNTEELRPFIAEIVEHLPHLGVGVAGGLGPNSLKVLEPLRQYFPVLSIDAQSRLHIGDDAMERLDFDKVMGYVKKATELFAET